MDADDGNLLRRRHLCLQSRPTSCCSCLDLPAAHYHEWRPISLFVAAFCKRPRPESASGQLSVNSRVAAAWASKRGLEASGGQQSHPEPLHIRATKQLDGQCGPMRSKS